MYNMDILIHIVDTVHLKVNALILSYANPPTMLDRAYITLLGYLFINC